MWCHLWQGFGSGATGVGNCCGQLVFEFLVKFFFFPQKIMARRYGSESSDDDIRGEYFRHSSRSKRHDERRRDVDREKSTERDPRGRESSDEEGELIERDRGSQRNERKSENGRREREKGSYRDEGEKPHRRESERRGVDTGGSHRSRGRDSHHYSERKDEREEHRTLERKKDKRDDDQRRLHKKQEDERREGEDRSLRENNGNSIPQGRLPEGKMNADVANTGKSGGVYIPPFKLARMMKEVEDKSSVQYQRLTWDALRKSINGLVNKVNAANIKNIIPEIFAENLIRGRGLFCRSCMKSQMASPGFTDVFAALVAVVNTKFPEVGELLLRRIVLQLKRAFKRNDKVRFFSHALLFYFHSFVFILRNFIPTHAEY